MPLAKLDTSENKAVINAQHDIEMADAEIARTLNRHSATIGRYLRRPFIVQAAPRRPINQKLRERDCRRILQKAV